MILVTGGAGYIGSHTLLALRERGGEVVVIDDLSEGHKEALLGARHELGTLLDLDFVDAVFKRYPIRAVVHFAARCYVGESVHKPGLYWRGNVLATLHLLETMARYQVPSLVFSSTCATYGEPERQPITEDAPQKPVNPYGETKLACERMMRDFGKAHGIATVALRYFNAAGADPAGRLGEDHDPETHLIPLVLQAASGVRDKVTVFGSDYPTRDGTCIRDYIHICDLASAHVLALDALGSGRLGGFQAFNLGNERGNTVLEVIASAERATKRKVPYVIGARRAGDPPMLVGSSELARKELGWQPRFPDIDSIVATAAAWFTRRPKGYSTGYSAPATGGPT